MAIDGSRYVHIDLHVICGALFLELIKVCHQLFFGRTVFVCLSARSKERVPSGCPPSVWNAFPRARNDLGIFDVELEHHTSTISPCMHDLGHSSPLLLAVDL